MSGGDSKEILTKASEAKLRVGGLCVAASAVGASDAGAAALSPCGVGVVDNALADIVVSDNVCTAVASAVAAVSLLLPSDICLRH